jgi:hypothetical protein
VLVDAGVLADHDAALEESRQARYRKYPRLQRLRLNRLWTGLHIGVAAYGAVLVLITFLVRWPAAGNDHIRRTRQRRAT